MMAVAQGAEETAPVGPDGPGDAGGRGGLRWVWWSTFFVFALLGTCWNLAQPQFSGTDERAHFVAAQAVWSGQILPPLDRHTPTQEAVGLLHGVTGPIENVHCMMSDPAISAACTHKVVMSTSHGEGQKADYLSREPPLPAFLNGWPIAIHPSVLTLYLGRGLDTLIGATGVATAIALAASRRRPFLLVGAVLATTPSVVAAFGVLGSSQLEIGTSLVVWTTVVLLVDGQRPTRRFLVLTAAFATVLVVSRPLSFVYLGLAAITLLVVSRRATLLALARTPAARIGALVVGAFTVFSLAWAAFAEAPSGNYNRHNHLAPIDGIGDKINYVLANVQVHWFEALGGIGPSDYLGPWWVIVGWSLMIGLAVGGGLLFASRRRVLMVVVLGAALLAVPAVVEIAEINSGRIGWQGRYDVPTLAGIILLACAPLDRALASTPQLRCLATAAVTLAGLLQAFEFIGALRRYAVGIDGPLDPRNWVSGWHPPIPILLLLVLGVLATIAAFTTLGVHQRRILRQLGIGRRSDPHARFAHSRTGPTRPL